MRGRTIRTLAHAGLALVLTAIAAVALAAPASAQINPRNILFDLIDQLQTGRNRPVLYGPEVQNTIAAQTNDTGIYQNLRRLGPVTGIRVDRSQPLQGGTLYYMTAQHQAGLSTWELGYSMRTERIEAFRFTIGAGATPPAVPPPIVPTPPATPPPTTTSGKKPLAPPRGTTPPQTPPPVGPTVGPTAGPTVAPPTTPPPTTRPPTTTDTSEACRKFPNLC